MGIMIALAFAAVSAVIGVIMAIMGAFINNIIIFDSIVIALAGGIAANKLLHIHPAFCLLIGIALFVLMFLLQRTKFGFWIIGGLLTVFWSFIFATITYLFSEDSTWAYVIWGLSAAFVAGLHLYAKKQIE